MNQRSELQRTRGPVLPVSSSLLNGLPTLNADDWFESPLDSEMRDWLNLEVCQCVRKEEIIGYARR